MGTTSTVNGLPVPGDGDGNDVVADLLALVGVLDGGSVVKRLTSTQIAALTSGQKPAGLVVYNSTTSRLQISNGATFADVALTGDAPTAHAASHAAAGADAVTLAQSQVTGLTAALAAFGAWQAWNPALTQPAAIERTVNYGAYCLVGDLVIAAALVTCIGNGQALQPIGMTLPVQAQAGGASAFGVATGVGAWNRGGDQRMLTATLASDSVLYFRPNSVTTLATLGQGDGITLTGADVMSVLVAYQRAA